MCTKFSHALHQFLTFQSIGGGDGGGGGGPWFFGTLFARKDRDTLIEQSGSRYSNRTVTVFREAV